MAAPCWDRQHQLRTPGDDTSGDNEAGGGPALSSLITYARQNYP